MRHDLEKRERASSSSRRTHSSSLFPSGELSTWEMTQRQQRKRQDHLCDMVYATDRPIPVWHLVSIFAMYVLQKIYHAQRQRTSRHVPQKDTAMSGHGENHVFVALRTTATFPLGKPMEHHLHQMKRSHRITNVSRAKNPGDSARACPQCPHFRYISMFLITMIICWSAF